MHLALAKLFMARNAVVGSTPPATAHLLPCPANLQPAHLLRRHGHARERRLQPGIRVISRDVVHVGIGISIGIGVRIAVCVAVIRVLIWIWLGVLVTHLFVFVILPVDAYRRCCAGDGRC